MNARFAQNWERGYGLANEEGEAGMVAMASPIFVPLEKKSRAVGTVSIAGPMVRMTSKRIIQISKELKAAALEFSRIWPMRRFVEGTPVSAEASKVE